MMTADRDDVKILFVDDEQHLLEAMVRQLRRSYQIDTATGGRQALDMLETAGSYAVIVSDLRMPGMDGITLLQETRKISPDCVRIILSGTADLATAIDAVNSGQVFRFLTKPCSAQDLRATLSLALRQYMLVTAERELLNKTLKGSITMLSEMLSLANPRAFSKGYRIRNLVGDIARSMDLNNSWRVEVAALLSQIGCIAVPGDILEKVAAGIPLNEQEKKIYADHPRVGARLVGRIPRLETVAAILKNQMSPPAGRHQTGTAETVARGSQILKAALDYDALAGKGLPHTEIIGRMYGSGTTYDPDVLEHLEKARPHLPKRQTVVNLLFDELVPGMVVAEDVFARNGSQILDKGQEITWPVLESLHNFIKHIGIQEPVKVWMEE